MTHTRRVVRAVAAVAVAGVAPSILGYLVVAREAHRLADERAEAAATDALQQLDAVAAGVEQVLGTANGVVAATGFDADRFATVLGPEVDTSTAIRGMALLVDEEEQAIVGETRLLDARTRAGLGTVSGTTLVTNRKEDGAFALGFVAPVADGSGAVYLEVVIPVAVSASGSPFALVSTGGKTEVLLGTVASVDGLQRWHDPVLLGGQQVAVFIEGGDRSVRWFGIWLPHLVAATGVVLTGIAMFVAQRVVRRRHAMQMLSAEKRELRAWQERFRAILRDTPDAIAIVDREVGSWEVLNRPDFFGHGLACVEVDGGIGNLLHPEDVSAAAALWAALCELEPEQVLETTLRLRDADGSDRFVRMRFSPLLDIDAERHHLLVAYSDVTEQWAQQEREAELEAALRRAQRLEAVGQLAGGIAHDFNNVLSAILSCAELLADTATEGKQRMYAVEIQRATTRGASLVRQLLTYAKRDAAQPRVVDLNEILTDMEPLLQRTLGEHVQLQVTRSDDPCTLLADPTHLEQVIVNLALNARDAMPDGGVLWIETSVANDRIVVSVTDTGEGVAPNVRERMFEPFFTTKGPGRGSGLGLSMVLGIVEGLEGRVRVASEPGQGTSFEIVLPWTAGTPAEPDVEPEPDTDGAGRRVLLVEDDVAVRTSIGQILHQRGFVVTPVGSASEALLAVERQDFDIVLSDAVMPGMSGTELLRRLETAPTSTTAQTTC